MLVSPRASLVGLKSAPAGPLFELAEQLAATFAKERAILQISMPGAMVDAQCPADCFSRLDARIRQLVHSYATCGGSDWRDMVAFNPHHYVRHLVDGNEDFELMLICWSPGQASRVHNHASSHCWLTVLEGQVEEEVFGEAPDAGCWPSRPDSPRPAMPGVLTLQDKCPELLLKHHCLLETPATGYINDSLGLHRVTCPEQTAAPGAVTLHLYAPPIRRVKLYEPEEGRVITRVPGFHSVRGRRCAIS
ncbi:RmlC-like cupin domain-containing protein [Haematococcus lacustris]